MVFFTKMHGIGNDYIYINCLKNNIKNHELFAKVASNRNFGIGADGVILIDKSEKCDLKMRIFNYDGTEAEMCGNGIRCVGKYAYEKGLVKKDVMTIETLAGIKILKLNIKNGYVIDVTVNMGEPVIKEDERIKIQNKVFNLTRVSIGNPHAIIFVNNVNNIDVLKYGKLISENKIFPNRTNVEFVEIVDKNTLKVRVYERGAGETLACGTGACAALVASNSKKFVDKSVDIILEGGVLKVEWNKKENNIYMTGPATIVYEGKIDFK